MVRRRREAGCRLPFKTAQLGIAVLVVLVGCRTDPPESESEPDARRDRELSDVGEADVEVDAEVSHGPLDLDSGSDVRFDVADGLDGAEVVPEVAGLEIIPSGPIELGRGRTRMLKARAVDGEGTEVPCPEKIDWTSSDTAVATVAPTSQDGAAAKVEGIALGGATIKARCEDVSTVLAVNVHAALPKRLQDRSKLAFWLPSEKIVEKGGDVATWRDETGNGYNFEASSKASRPSFRNSVLNGHDAVEFDGGSEELRTTNYKNNFVETKTATVFFVATNGDASRVGQLLASCGVGDHHIRFDGAAKAIRLFADGSYRDERLTGLSISTTQWHVLTVVLDTAAVEVFQNGAMSASTSVGATSGTWRFNQIGARCMSEYLDGSVAEVLLYHTALKDGDRKRVEGYLRNKFDL